jgi:hypothetical protein
LVGVLLLVTVWVAEGKRTLKAAALLVLVGSYQSETRYLLVTEDWPESKHHGAGALETEGQVQLVFAASHATLVDRPTPLVPLEPL